MTRYAPGRASVVIPCFNASRYLREAIESALAQTHRDVEVVVCDDGSRDDSAAIAESFGSRVQCLRQANAGPSAARNRALAAATGEYVALLDADDRFHAPKLERQIAVLAERPAVGAVYCGWRLVDEAARPLPEQGWPRVEGDLLPRLVLGNLFHPVSVVMRRTVIDAAGGFDPRCPVNEDWDLFLRAGRTGVEWAVVDEALCDYRIHPGQSHERLGLVHGVAREILERFFADPDLPDGLRRLEPAAFEHADLRAAAELYAAGSDAEAAKAFGRAVARRREILAEPRTLMRFLRLVLPDGHRHRTELVRRRARLLRILRVALESGAVSLQDRRRAWTTLAAIAVRLRVRALRSVRAKS
jgi:hypothetical protein